MAHHARDVRSVRCLVLVVSDTRSVDSDTGGKQIADALEEAGHRVLERVVVRDECQEIRARVLDAAESGECGAVILTGGTGLAHRDVTPEAIEPLLTHELPGFGEAFRRLSYDKVGVHGLFSRAFAGAVDQTVVFALPGSPRACADAMEQLVIPMLPHAVGLSRR